MRAAVRQPHPAGALDMDEEGIGPVREPDDLESLPGEGTLLDLAAGEIGHRLAIDHAAIRRARVRARISSGNDTRSGGRR